MSNTWFEENGTFNSKSGEYTLKNGLNHMWIKFSDFQYGPYKKQNLKTVNLSSFEGRGLSSVCFQNCNSLQKVVLSPNIKVIGGNCFEGCTELSEINLDYVERISSNSFKNCKKLEFLKFGNKLNSILQGAFEGCSKLKKVSNLNNLTMIETNAFGGCTELIGDFIFEKPITIWDKTFFNCKKLKNIHFKNKVIFQGNILDGTFEGCENLPEDILSDKSGITWSIFKDSNLHQISLEKWINIEKKFDENWKTTKEPLFPAKNGLPSPSDIVQGRIGDCWFLAILSSIAASDPEIIKNCMQDDIKNNCVYVTLFIVTRNNSTNSIEPVKKIKIKVERSIAVHHKFTDKIKYKFMGYTNKYCDKHALWVRIMEKAIAIYVDSKSFDIKEFSEILNGSGNSQIRSDIVMSAITGREVEFSPIVKPNNNNASDNTALKVFTDISKKIKTGQIITCNLNEETPCGGLLPTPHAYSLIGTLMTKNKCIDAMNILPNTYSLYEKNISPLFDSDSLKSKLGNQENLFFILRNPHGKNGVITIPKNNDYNFKDLPNNRGICIVEVKFFIKYFNNEIIKTSNN